MKLALVLLLVSADCIATDWLCSEVSSQRRGSSILACGIGHAPSEEEARSRALEAAAHEFERVCDLSSDCRREDVRANPERTECAREAQGYACRRLVEFEGVKKSHAVFKRGSDFYRRFLVNRLGPPDAMNGDLWHYHSESVCRETWPVTCLIAIAPKGLTFTDVRSDVQLKLEAALGQE